MGVYIIFWLIIFLLSFKVKKGKFTFYDFLLITIIVLFSGLRAVGTDYSLYNRIFDGISINSLGSRTGIGFNYLIYFVKFVLQLDYQFFIFLFAALTNIIIYYFVKKNSNKPGLAMLIYISAGFYTTSFNMFRQALSIALILLSSQLIEDKKYIKTGITWTIAYYIHSSSIIAIIIYVLARIFKYKKIRLKYLLPIPIIGLLLYDKMFIYLISMLDSYSMYSNYNATPGIGTYINVFVYLVVTVFLIIPKYKKTASADEKVNYNNYNLFLIGVAIMLLELKNFLFFRIAFYFTILTPIILTEFYEEHHLQRRKTERLIFYTCLIVYFLVYVNSFDGVLPYRFFFTSV